MALLPEGGNSFKVWRNDSLEALDGIDSLRNNLSRKN
jgi:hypothetical protein